MIDICFFKRKSSQPPDTISKINNKQSLVINLAIVCFPPFNPLGFPCCFLLLFQKYICYQFLEFPLEFSTAMHQSWPTSAHRNHHSLMCSR